MEDEAANLSEPLPVSGQRPDHLLEPRDVVVRGAEELEQALDRVLPEHPCAAAAEPRRDLHKARIGGGELAPEVSEGDGRVQVVAQRDPGGGYGRGGGVVVVEEEGKAVVVVEVGEGDEVWAHGSGESEQGEGGAAVEEGLAGGEAERQGEFGEIGRDPSPPPLVSPPITTDGHLPLQTTPPHRLCASCRLAGSLVATAWESERGLRRRWRGGGSEGCQ